MLPTMRQRVLVLAGRRADPVGASEQLFPLQRLSSIVDALAVHFEERAISAYVSSAASGADLVGLEAVARMSARPTSRTIVLPFARGKFRATSVADRPGPWPEW